MNISDLQREFKQYALMEKGIMPKTYKSIWGSVRQLAEYGKSNELTDLDLVTVKGFLYAGRSEKGWASQTFRNHWQYLKIFFDWCLRKEYLRVHPVIDIERPKPTKQLPRFITSADAQKILYHTAWYKWRYRLEKPRNEAIITTLLMTGIRLQELLNLLVHDVNLSNETIFVRQGKNRKDRILPIHPQLSPILRTYVHEKRQFSRASLWFFSGIKSEKQLNQKDVRTVCKKITIASGVKFTPHMLRHTFAREMVNQDFNLYKLQQILGHAQISTTQIYLSVSTAGIKRSFDEVKLF